MKNCEFCISGLAQFECNDCASDDCESLMCESCMHEHVEENPDAEINIFVD